ncbi:unnamed protein product [Prunus armeniaca]|uniref:Uncharacterized protein n=1 Tax=Prunus armeniaca TaxID=36596 RepID=A0A6J5UIY1_PRUAR|nr:unnamed protein product [Prunus armeniaca]CAB4306406.1 unnamed protein product [Prunus armeniaca]
MKPRAMETAVKDIARKMHHNNLGEESFIYNVELNCNQSKSCFCLSVMEKCTALKALVEAKNGISQ